MNNKKKVFRLGVLSAGLLMAALTAGNACAADAEAAKALARQNNCFRCHGVEKAKDGPSWKEVSTKLKGDPQAEAKLIHHVTSGEKAKFPDGHEEEHKVIKTSPANDQAQIKNLVDWILSL